MGERPFFSVTVFTSFWVSAPGRLRPVATT